MLLRPALDITALVIAKAGIVDRDVQFENILAKVVTAVVLKRGIVLRQLQVLNMLDMLVTRGVLKSGTLLILTQP